MGAFWKMEEIEFLPESQACNIEMIIGNSLISEYAHFLCPFIKGNLITRKKSSFTIRSACEMNSVTTIFREETKILLNFVHWPK